MSRIKAKNTIPELVVRRYLHASGYRFRLHQKNLPGKPDIVLPKHKTIILVHGCFWHRHTACKNASFPKTNKEFWAEKFKQTVERDKRNISDLESLGWRVLIIWECQIKDNSFKSELLESLNSSNSE